MNQQDKIELSKRVAEKLGIDASISNTYEDRYLENGHYQYEEVTNTTWLADDDARCFRLMIDYGITLNGSFCGRFIYANNPDNEIDITEFTDVYEATRIAILKCLENME